MIIKFNTFLNESNESNGYLKLQRCQQGKVEDGWDFRSFRGQHGEGVYAFFYGDQDMIDYYTKNEEEVHTFQIPMKYVIDLSYKNWDFWDAKAFIYKNSQYKAFIFRHSGDGIPTSKEVLITDQNIIGENILNELKQASSEEYYNVLDQMYSDNSSEMLQMIKHFDSIFPRDSKTIYKTDDDSLFIQYAEVKTNIFNGPGLYILGMASKTKKMNRKSIQDMYELLDIFKDMIYPGLNIFASVNSNTEPLIKRLTNIIKEKGLTSNFQILGQHDFGSEPEEQYKTYGISIK